VPQLACAQIGLLYTDGVIEPENARGDSFGEFKFEQVVRDNQSRAPSELLDQLLSEIREWQPPRYPSKTTLRSSSSMWFGEVIL